MGWADCGDDSQGRPIGYAHEALCDFEGCDKQIDRGLAYACGGMHGEDNPEGACEGYFCYEHLESHGCCLQEESETLLSLSGRSSNG